MKKKIPLFLASFLLLVCSSSITMAAQSTSQGAKSYKRITGLVVDASNKGEPAVGASVRLKGTNKCVATDLEGHFKIDAQLGDTLSVKYSGCEVEVAIDAQQLRISICNFMSGLCCGDNLPKGVFGTVYSVEGKPLVGATVTALPSGKSTITDSKGYFNITQLEKSDKSLRVKHPTYKTLRGRIDGNCFEIYLEKNIVTGIVLDEEGDPIQNAKVKDEIGNVSALTDFDGRFSINVNDGTRLTVSYPAVRSQKVVGYSCLPLTVILDFNDTVRAINLDSLSRLKPKVKTLTSNSEIAQNSIHSFTVNGVNFNMVEVDGGTFLMGATAEQGEDAVDNEWPAHEVTVPSFCIGQTEVTQELWMAVMGENPSWCNGERDYSVFGLFFRGVIDYGTNLMRPVENVSWDDCQEFISRLNKLTGEKFRLPTEAEWEFAACGGNHSKGYKYSGSDNLNDVGWYWQNSGDSFLNGYFNWDHTDRQSNKMVDNKCMSHSVATKYPNELGIYDMSGNMSEWCQDNWHKYDGSKTDFSHERVVRDGHWDFEAFACRVSYRISVKPNSRSRHIGLRLAL